MTTSLQQARQACIAAQTQVNALTDALANASQQLLNVYKGFGKHPNDHETFILKINQQYPSIQNLTIPIEQQYQDAYVALQEANDKLQIAQTLVDQLSSNQNDDVLQAVQSLCDFVSTKFIEMEKSILVLNNKIVAVDNKIRATDEHILNKYAELSSQVERVHDELQQKTEITHRMLATVQTKNGQASESLAATKNEMKQVEKQVSAVDAKIMQLLRNHTMAEVADKLGVHVDEIVFVSPGENSLQSGYEEALSKGLFHIHLYDGVHTISGSSGKGGSGSTAAAAAAAYVTFTHPMTISGAGKGKTFVKGGGFLILGRAGKKQFHILDMTITQTKEHGLKGQNGLAFDCLNIHFDQCGQCGVFVEDTNGRLTNCQVTNCIESGIVSYSNSLVEIEGEETKIESNVKSQNVKEYGLSSLDSTSSINILAPLTKELISTKNQGGGNCGGDYTIETVNSF